jgi:transcriptional regulator with XRE-family HTH domain
MLGWSARALATASGLSLRTIQTIENSEVHQGARKSSVLAVKAALQAAGIEFIGTADEGPGIRLWKDGRP